MHDLLARFRLGAWEVAALSDGVGAQRPADWFPGVPDAEWMRATGASAADHLFPVNFGSFLVRGAGRTVLIDTGNGPRTAGQHHGAAGLLDRLADLDVRPDEVDTVLLTHFHGDHVGWNTSEPEGGPVTFPRATFWLHEADVAHLERPEAEEWPSDRFSRSKIWPVRDLGRLETFEGERSPLPGFTFVPTPGHTPGHCSIVVESDGERLLVVGDAAPHTTHLEHPDWAPVFDLDPSRASDSRRALAVRAARERLLVTGGHFPILTVGHVEAVPGSNSHRWVPVEVERVDSAT
jgi:glyoxylase-like metal-dependent hydrolase (beta-lactamase superfamily II)